MSALAIEVARAELGERGKRGLLVVWTLVTFLVAYGVVAGNVTISSGSSAVGAAKAHVTSGFAVAQIVAVTAVLLHGFFAAFVSGLPVLRDRELGVQPLLFATRMSMRAYVGGKLGAALGVALALVALEVATLAVLAHALPLVPPSARGPFSLRAYAVGLFAFGVPFTTALVGGALALACTTRKRALVILLPLVLLVVLALGAWQVPETAPRWAAAALGALDPSGFSWLRFEHLAEDRGVAYYNQTPLPLTASFVASRVAWTCAGVLAPLLVASRVARGDEGGPRSAGTKRDGATRRRERRSRRLPLLVHLVVTELRLLRAHAGLWVSVPLVLLVTLQDAMALRGPFDTALAPTPGLLAQKAMGTLVTFAVLLVLFTVVESFARDRASRAEPIVATTPTSSHAFVWAKVLASVVFAALVMSAAALALLAWVAVRNPSSLALTPFALLWGLLGLPTVFFAASFFALMSTFVRSRYATYGVGVFAIVATGFAFVRGHLGWPYNWPLWKVIAWSDMSILELDRRMLVANRLAVLALGVAFTFATATATRRARREHDRDADAATAPARRLRTRLEIAAACIPAGIALLHLVVASELGPRGTFARDDESDYHRANVRTYLDAALPDLADVDLRARFEPALQTVDVDGAFVLVNGHDTPLRRIPLTLRRYMKAPTFTLDGRPVLTEARSGLFVIHLAEPLPPNGRARVGFTYRAVFADAVSSFGVKEFLVPAGGTLTSFDASFVPAVGFVDGIGVEERDRPEPRTYEPDFHVGETPGLLGTGTSFTYRLEATMPPEYTVTSVGVLRDDRREHDRRVMVWEADAPVHFYNVIVGRDWEVRRRGDVELRFHPDHGANVDEMLEALAEARERYSAWFYPYPWKELRLSEFPGLVHYAQGHPTNINFSESVGFLAARGEDLPFAITAHEVGHQWWGTLVNPAKGPGAAVLTEGLSHMSALLLLEAVKGPEARKRFARAMEERYAKDRSLDGERPLVRVDGARKGDTTLTYDRGGWAFWMLAKAMTLPRFSAGMHDFVAKYRESRDHPAIADLFETLRPFAADPAELDVFREAWFESTSVPRLRVEGATALPSPTGARVDFRLVDDGNGRGPVRVRVFGRGETASRPFADVVLHLASDARRVQGSVDVPFEPAEIVVDPEVELLQLGRAAARADVGRPGSP